MTWQAIGFLFIAAGSLLVVAIMPRDIVAVGGLTVVTCVFGGMLIGGSITEDDE